MSTIRTAVRILAVAVVSAVCVLLLLTIAAVTAVATLLLLVSLTGPIPPGMPDPAAPITAIAGASVGGYGLVWLFELRPGPVKSQPLMAVATTTAAWLLMLAALIVAEASLLFALAYIVVSFDQAFPNPLMALVIVTAAAVNICALTSAPPRAAAAVTARLTMKEASCDT